MSPNFVSPEQINEIRQRLNVIDTLSRYLKLEKAGRRYKALCPFHDEKTPSFTVDPDTGLYYCFGCQAGGDIFNFLMEIEGWSFPEAVRYLAEVTGVEISKEERSADNHREVLYKINKFANRLFRRAFASEMGQNARNYLAERGFSEDIIKTAEIGYAPEGWDFIVKRAARRNIPMNFLVELGLAAERNNTSQSGESGGYYDKYRNRVIFPIHDIMGRVIGFGGRILGDGQPKYLNSPEMALYHKSKTLYGLYQARSSIKSESLAIRMEGYLDVLAAWQAGVTNVVASLGTALTPEQGRLLRRYTDRCLICYDGDRAGLRAAQRGIEILKQEGLNVQVIMLPDGQDPDDYIKAHGAAAFKKVINEQALDYFTYLVSVTEKNYRLDIREEKMKFINELVILISGVENRLEKAGYLNDYSQLYNLDRAALEFEVEQVRQRHHQNQPHNQVESAKPMDHKISGLAMDLERKLLRHIMNSHHKVSPALFASRVHRNLLTLILTYEDDPQELVEKCQSADERAELARILMIEGNDKDEERIIEQLTKLRLNEEISLLRVQIREASKLGDDVSNLLQEYNRLEHQRASLARES